MSQIIVTEVALRDGSHAVSHSFTVPQVHQLATALDDAKVPYLEVSHGDGLGGSSLQYGRSTTDEFELIEAAVAATNFSKVAVLLLPGIGTVKELRQAQQLGVKMVRVATHATEADVSAQHIYTGKDLGLEVVGFLMMASMASAEKLVEQALLMESYGADVIYMTDSAGAMLPAEVSAKITALRQALRVDIGFHGHNNLGLAMGNTLAAIEAGATRVDGSIRALGAGAGNTQTEVLVAVLAKMGLSTGIDLFGIMDAAEDIAATFLSAPQEITKDSLTLGYAGVYSSFRLHAQVAAQRYQLDARDILIELGKQQVIGGQEDMIMDVAAKLALAKK